MIKLPGLISNGEVDWWLEVPNEWHEHRLHASDLHDRIKYSIHKNEAVKQTQLARSSNTYGGINGLQIEILGNKQKLKDSVPSQKEGIPLKMKDFDGGELACYNTSEHCVNYEENDFVLGGEYLDGGTACCRVISPNNNPWLLTAAHLFYDPDDACSTSESDLIGRNADVYNGNKVGEVVSADISGDWALIEKAGTGSTYSSEIDNNDSITHYNSNSLGCVR